MQRCLAGFAKVGITPPSDCWLAGYGSRRHRAMEILDPLYARCLVLADGDNAAAIVVADVLGLGAATIDQVRRKIGEQGAIPPENVHIAATHTHSGPTVKEYHGFGPVDHTYVEELKGRLTEVVQAAASRLRPALLYIGSGQSFVGVNRREYRDGRFVIGENPGGPIDRRLFTLSFWDYLDHEDGEPDCLGVLLWFAMHPVTLGGSNYLVSRDFPGYTIDFLEQQLPTEVAIFVNGPCGNINPIRGEERGLELTRALGLTLGKDALRAVYGAKLGSGSPGSVAKSRSVIDQKTRILSGRQSVAIPLQPLPSVKALQEVIDQRIVHLREIGLSPEEFEVDGILAWAKAALAEWQKGPVAGEGTTEAAEISALVISDLAFVFIPAEVFQEVAEEITASSPFRPTLVVSYANGYFGYLPHAMAFEEGGYEPDQSYQYLGLRKLDPSAATIVTETAQKLLNRLAKTHKRQGIGTVGPIDSSEAAIP